MKKELLMGICLLAAIIAGCLSNPAISANNSAELHEKDISHTTPIPLTQPQTKITTATVVTTITPHFTGTISTGANKLTIGSNQSPPITEDKAWEYAEQYLVKYKLQNFSQAEVVSQGQGKKTFENGTQTWTWNFKVRRCNERMECYGLAIVNIDANDGHLIFIGFLD
jgi:hypothetical protein